MKRYIPNQHGAWAMLVVPFVFGLFAADPKPVHGLMFVCWFLAYLFTFPVLQWIRTGKAERYRKPALVYGAILLPLGVWLLLWQPWLLLYGAALLPLFAVNGVFAKLNRERAVWNDLAAIVQFSSVIFPVYKLGGGTDWDLAVRLFVISLLYFAGTVYYVKTLIREKGNTAYFIGSVAYHLALAIAAAVLREPALAGLAVLLLARAAIVPKTRLTVKRSGMMEIAVSALVAVIGLISTL